MTRDATRTSVLLTGFGPFPGVPENPSARLVDSLAGTLSARPGIALEAEILSTEWSYVTAEAPALFERVKPKVSIHFGICRGANSFRIERSAYNAAGPLTDAAGALPLESSILVGGKPRLDTGAPAASIAKRLRDAGIPALPSLSAGRYLCNFLYYHSLDWGARQQAAPLALFVHIPPSTREGGHFSDAEILRGTEAVLDHLLDMLADDISDASEAA